MANRFSLCDRLCCVSPLTTNSGAIKWVLENVSRFLTVLQLFGTAVPYHLEPRSISSGTLFHVTWNGVPDDI